MRNTQAHRQTDTHTYTISYRQKLKTRTVVNKHLTQSLEMPVQGEETSYNIEMCFHAVCWHHPPHTVQMKNPVAQQWTWTTVWRHPSCKQETICVCLLPPGLRQSSQGNWWRALRPTGLPDSDWWTQTSQHGAEQDPLHSLLTEGSHGV